MAECETTLFLPQVAARADKTMAALTDEFKEENIGLRKFRLVKSLLNQLVICDNHRVPRAKFQLENGAVFVCEMLHCAVKFGR